MLVKRVPALTPEDAAEFLAVSPATLKAWRSRGGGPVYSRMKSGQIRYRLPDLEAFRDGDRRVSTKEAFHASA